MSTVAAYLVLLLLAAVIVGSSGALHGAAEVLAVASLVTLVGIGLAWLVKRRAPPKMWVPPCPPPPKLTPALAGPHPYRETCAKCPTCGAHRSHEGDEHR